MSENRSGRTPAEELKKQLIDQPLHALWGYTTGILPWLAVHFAGPWGAYAIPASLASGIYWIARELHQAEDGSHVWWDPYLDSGIWFLACLGGVLTGILAL